MDGMMQICGLNIETAFRQDVEEYEHSLSILYESV